MEDAGTEPSGGSGVGSWVKWSAVSAFQLGIGIYSYRKVQAGECRLMPLKAFGIASLFVGAGFTSFVAIVTANGVHSVNDVIEVGANIRSSLGARPKGTR
ncbi:hypothetical protein OROGR_023716 [Orobanche gracilis]